VRSTRPSEVPVHSRFSRATSPGRAGNEARWANGKSPIVGTCTRPVTAASEAARETIVVIEGTALRLPIADLDRELKDNDHFRHVLTEYSHALLIASMRTSACNGLHGLQERCARWMLMTLDRVDADRFAVTKEFLAQLLGTNRSTASVLVSALEKAGILNVEGRWVTLADRNRLKEAACECYDIIRKTYEAVG
jgi:Crp-like helix-turn-helix protein